jgi:hypothetical protein
MPENRIHTSAPGERSQKWRRQPLREKSRTWHGSAPRLISRTVADVRLQPPPVSTVVAAYEGETFGGQGSRDHDAAFTPKE